MKKTFTILIAAIAAILMMAQPMKVVAQDIVVTLNNIGAGLGTSANTTEATTDITATGTTDVYTLNYYQCKKQSSGSNHAMFMTKSVYPYISNHTAMPGKIKSVEVFIMSGAAKATTYDCAFSTTECHSAVSGIGAVNITGGNSHTFSNLTGGVINVQGEYFCITLGNANNGQVLKLVITCENSSSTAVATTTTIDDTGITNTDIKDGTAAGSLSASVTYGSPATSVPSASVSWSGNNDAVATINPSTGAVTLVSMGTVKFTATYAGVEGTYQASSADYNMTVTDSRYVVSDLTFTAAYGQGAGVADDGVEWTVESDGSESSFDNTKGIHYGTGSAAVQYIRLSTSDITEPIAKVIVNASTANNVSATVGVTIDGSAFGGDAQTLSSSAADYTFASSTNAQGEIIVTVTKPSSATGALYVKSVKVTYLAPAVKAPNIDVPTEFVGSTTAKITCETTGATIKYNFDGGSTWNTYITDLNITETTTIYAKAVKAEDESNVVSKTTTKTYNVNIDDLTNGTITATPNVAAEGDEITLTITPDDCYQLKSGTLVVWDDEFNEISVTNNKFDMPGSDVLVSAEFELIKYAVQYSVNGVVGELEADLVNCGEDAYLYDADDLEDAGVSLPTGCSFAGWSANPASTAVVSSFYPDADATLYAVLSQSSGSSNYVKVTEDLKDWSGEYLIVYEDSENGNLALDGSLTTLDASSNTISVNINTIGGNSVIESNSTTNAASFIIASKTNGYSIKSASNLYIGHSGSKNTLNTSEYDDYTNTISVDGSASIACDNYYMRYNSTSGQERFRYYTSGQQDIQLYKKQTGTSYTRIFTDETNATANITIEGPTLITSGAVLNMGEHQLSNSDVANLIIEDGGQLIVNNSGVKATVKKALPEAAKSKDENWTTIASPVKNISIGDTYEDGNVTHLKDVAYALYRLNETTSEWENYKNGAYHDGEDGDDFEILEAGRGYLYSRTSLTTLEYVGEVNGDEYTEYTLTMSGNKISGFHLIGNPYSHDIYKGAKGKGCAISNTSDDDTYVLATGFYQLKNGTSWLPKLDDGTKIEKGEGILVQATTAGTLRIYNSATAPAKANTINHDNIMFTVVNGQHEDVAYAMFDKGIGLSKINHRDNVTPMIYIEQKGEDYAIATMSDDTKSFNLNFKAMTTGQYTLSYKANGDFNYLHIIDRLTGEDVDMLIEGEYKFIGTPSDKDNRFIVKLGYMPDYSDADNDIFAYQSGSDILVSGAGELQIFDITGRKVMTTMINGAESINLSAKGVYVFRLVGETIKTQKIVVR